MHWLLSFCLLLLPTSCQAVSPDEDEAWIERHMAKPGQSAVPAATQSGFRVGWGELKRYIGRTVEVQTQKGVRHRGEIERVEGSRLFLRSRLHGGYAELVLRREQVIGIELE